MENKTGRYESAVYAVNGRKQRFTIENRTPILTRQERDERLRRIEGQLFEVFRKVEKPAP